MFRKATVDDITVIREIAGEAFPATYASILTKEQIDYMMEWMYSEDALRKELEGDVIYLLLEIDGKAAGYVSFGPEGDGGIIICIRYISCRNGRAGDMARYSLPRLRTRCAGSVRKYSN